MNTWKLMKKEFKETRTQGVIFTAVIIFFGASSVLMQKFIPMLVPEDLAEAFTPSLITGLNDYVSNTLQIGSVVAILITISAIAGERESGTLELLLARPVSKFQILASKFTVRASYVILGNIVAAGVTWYYAYYLFEPFSIGKLLMSGLAMGAITSFVLGLTMIFSAWRSSKLTVAFWSGGISLALAILPTVRSPYDMMSPFKYGDIARRVLFQGVTPLGYLKNIGILVGFTLFCLTISLYVFRTSERIS
ncbi:ABC transporter permease subunit [Candidatus Bipolaricaulota bacterium]|nr:ABC transporter permease subunit [Candidatus Bipolaricaulota bacterium]